MLSYCEQTNLYAFLFAVLHGFRTNFTILKIYYILKYINIIII